MARIRSLKPEFWESEDVNALSPLGRLAFIWLICHADDEGRLRASITHVAKMVGLSQRATEKQLQRMEARGMVFRYQDSDGSSLIQVIHFTSHQVINRPSKSRLPEPPIDGHSVSPQGGLTPRARADARSTPLRSVGIEETVKTGVVKRTKTKTAADHARAHEANGYEAFVTQLNSATGRAFRGDAQSRTLYRRRRKEGRSDEDLAAAARGVAKSAHHMGLNESQIPYNAPANVLRSRVLDQLISLGRDEIGAVRRMTKDEQRRAEVAAWAQEEGHGPTALG